MITTRPELRAYLEADRRALGQERTLRSWMLDEVWRYQRCLRKLEYRLNVSGNRVGLALAKYRYRRLGIRLGLSIPPNVFGPGLSIAHPGPIIVHSRARVGANCRISVGVTIGADARDDSVPVIGSDCFLGPGAKVFGGIEIGPGTAVGANAVVNRSFPQGHITLAGVPAVPVSERGTEGIRPAASGAGPDDARPGGRREVIFYMPSAAPLLREGRPGPAGGAENQVLMLARELARRGHAVGIVAFDDAGPLRRELDGVEIIEQRRPRVRLPVIRTLLYYASTLALLREHPAPVLVQSAAGVHTLLVGVAARMLGSRFVYATAGLIDFDLLPWVGRRWIVWAFSLGVRLADDVVVQTNEQAELCRRQMGRQPWLIASIAELPEAPPGPAGQPASPPEPAAGAPVPVPVREPESFLWIGALNPHKQPEAFVDLARSVPEARFRMVGVPSGGGGIAGEELSLGAAALENLELLAPRPRDELAELISTAVAVVSTSRSEGMPNVFLEAWSRGVPTLALAHDPDGVIEREGLGGFAHGSPARLARLTREQWQARGDRLELSLRCRGYVERQHALADVADRWTQVLQLPGHPRAI